MMIKGVGGEEWAVCWMVARVGKDGDEMAKVGRGCFVWMAYDCDSRLLRSCIGCRKNGAEGKAPISF